MADITPKRRAQLLVMPRATTTDRPFLIPGESGTDEALAPCPIRGFSDRPFVEFAGANCSANNPPPPDDLWHIRLADWLPASDAQPRSGGIQPADGGTIFFESVDEFSAELQFDARRGLQPIKPKPETGQRVVLWMRNGDPELRAVTIGGRSPARGTKLIPEKIESAAEFAFHEGFQIPRNLRERPQVFEAEAASPLAVWNLWANPLHPNPLHQ
jgi:hypothetical protein